MREILATIHARHLHILSPRHGHIGLDAVVTRQGAAQCCQSVETFTTHFALTHVKLVNVVDVSGLVGNGRTGRVNEPLFAIVRCLFDKLVLDFLEFACHGYSPSGLVSFFPIQAGHNPKAVSGVFVCTIV